MRATEVETILESQGFVAVRQTGSHRFFRNPETGLSTTVPMHTGDVAPGTLRSIWRQSGLINELAGVNSVREAMARLDARNAGPLPLTPDQRTVSNIVDNARTQSFWTDNNGRVAYMFSEEHKAVLAVTSDRTGHVVSATMRRFETAEEAANFFGEMRSRVARVSGAMPSIVSDGIRGLRAAFQSTHGGLIPPALRNAGDDVGRFLGKASKVLGVVGVVAASAEAANLALNARDLIRFGNLHPDAIAEYDSLLAGHITQATADPTLLGGEVATQAWFNSWADRWGLEEHERAQLQPGSLLQDLQAGVEMANTAIRAVARQALEAAGHAAGEITEAMLRAKMQSIARDVMNSGPDGLRRFIERNSDTLGRQLSPGEIGRLNRHFDGLNLSPITPSQPGILPGFRFPELPMPSLPELRIPNIIPEFRLPSIPNMIPGLRGDLGSPLGVSDQQFAMDATQGNLDMASLQTAMYEALPDDPVAIAALPESLQTMAVVKNQPELFASELSLFVEENGLDSAQSFIQSTQVAVSIPENSGPSHEGGELRPTQSNYTSMRV